MELIEKVSDKLVEISNGPNDVRIETKTYILDDLKALKKKWNMISHEPEIDVNGEAANGSSINIDMKTAIFEVMKAGLVDYLKKKADVMEVVFPMTSRAQSKNGEEADVEYHIDVSFVTNGVMEQVKMKCFTTNCRIQVQNYGKHEKKKHFGNVFTPKYFTDKFIVPFLRGVLVLSAEYEKVFVPHLKSEIQRLQKKKIQERGKKFPAIDTEGKNAKCENQNCQHKFNVILKNVEAYGQCFSCKGYEHFHCAGTSKIMKEEIKLRQAYFVCTNCIEKNPALGKEIPALETFKSVDSTIDTLEVLALVHSPPILSLDEVESTDNPIKVPHNNKEIGQQDVSSQMKCSECPFECNNEKDLRMHASEHEVNICPEYNCDICESKFNNENSLHEHKINKHTAPEYTCNMCDYKTSDKELLGTHVNFSHEIPEKFECEMCKTLFNDEKCLEEHKQLHVEATLAFLCDLCAHEESTDDALSKHKIEKHPVQAESVIDKEVDMEVNEKTDLNDENIEVKRKLRLIEESYDRLMGLFLKQQTECKDKALAYKTELEEANEQFRVVKTENEKLKEVNETQHKLWKIFLEKFEKEKEEKEKETVQDKKKGKPNEKN